MKHIKWIKLLSVLLCAVMLCTACAAPAEEPSDDGEATPVVPETPMLDAVEPTLNNFFGISAVNSWRTLGKATRLDGTMVDSNEVLLVLRNAKIDHLNNITETFTVYNTELQTEVLKVENTYEYGEYEPFDWTHYYYKDLDLKFPENVMKVEAAVDHYNGLPYIKVSRAKITPVEKAVFEENEGNSHTVEITYDYYDVAGTEIVKGAQKDDVHDISLFALSFVNVVATFDADTYKMTSKVDADNKVIRYDYDSENETYGYYLNGVQQSALGDTESFFEVYNKEDGSLVLRYYLDGDKGIGSAFAMAGGDVLVQYVKVVDKDKGEKYNFEFEGMPVMIETYLVDVPTGTGKKVEPGYFFEQIITAEDFIEEYDTESKGITLTKSAANMAIGIDISSGKLDENNPYDFLVLNNDGSVMFKMDRMIPEHVFGAGTGNGMDPFGYTQLPSGDYLVNIAGFESIRGDQATRAIVSAEGKVRAYLTDYAEVVGKYVVYDGNVYDYDMKPVFELSKNDYTFEGGIGNNIIVSKYIDEGMRYYKLTDNGGSLGTEVLLDGEDISRIDFSTDYIVVQTAEDGKYHLYNAELEHVLTTRNEMHINLCDDKYIVGTELYVEGEQILVFYTIG